MTSFSLLLLLAVVGIASCTASSAAGPVVKTNYGKVQGLTVTINLDAPTLVGRRKRSSSSSSHVNQTKVDAYFAVPFASPPLGALRYEKPAPPSSWSGLLNATTPALGCIPEYRQAPDWNTTASEDCLYLNVYTPHGSTENSMLPVMFIIHGGGYVLGSASPYYNVTDMGAKFVSKGLVVISIQYRLGFLGFATTGNNALPGNLGYWDQLAALKYVKENVKAFGGDPSRITLFGYSAGGSSVSALGLSPYSRDLFAQSIQMSGSVFALWTTDSRVINATSQLTSLLNCTTSAKDCLRNKTIDQVYDQIDIMNPTRYDLNFIKFGPYIDRDFFPADYPTLIRQSPPKPTIIGFEQEDGLAFTLMSDQNSSFSSWSVPASAYPTFGPSYISDFVKAVVARTSDFGSVAGAVQAAVTNFYTTGPSPWTGNAYYLQKYAQIITDLLFDVPALTEVQLKLNAGWNKLHIYHNVYVNNQTAGTTPENPVLEAYHNNAHMQMMGGFWIPPTPPTPNDYAQMAFLISSLVNFIKTGNPSVKSVEWTPATTALPTRSLQITQPCPSMANSMLTDRLTFWNGITANYTEYNIMRGNP